ncbi:hypothetical protein PR048_011844 [Dryococelus australis]|uniref:Uncharacterized protein n=1 Tax=Dryococelus australis TaxID=614101 RepID=A0ABQ9HMN5_9NEOP|nr:hypothetical protein PR048_011844 [Dryococelus australis]
MSFKGMGSRLEVSGVKVKGQGARLRSGSNGSKVAGGDVTTWLPRLGLRSQVPLCLSDLHARLPPSRTRFNLRPGHRIFSSANRAGRCRWSAGFLGDLPLPPPPHLGAAPYNTSINLIGSQDLAATPCKLHCARNSMEQLRNVRAGETGDRGEKPPTSGTVWHDTYTQSPEGLAWWEASTVCTTPPRPQRVVEFINILSPDASLPETVVTHYLADYCKFRCTTAEDEALTILQSILSPTSPTFRQHVRPSQASLSYTSIYTTQLPHSRTPPLLESPDPACIFPSACLAATWLEFKCCLGGALGQQAKFEAVCEGRATLDRCIQEGGSWGEGEGAVGALLKYLPCLEALAGMQLSTILTSQFITSVDDKSEASAPVPVVQATIDLEFHDRRLRRCTFITRILGRPDELTSALCSSRDCGLTWAASAENTLSKRKANNTVANNIEIQCRVVDGHRHVKLGSPDTRTAMTGAPTLFREAATRACHLSLLATYATPNHRSPLFSEHERPAPQATANSIASPDSQRCSLRRRTGRERGIGRAARLDELGRQCVGRLYPSPHSVSLTALGAATAADRLRAAV